MSDLPDYTEALDRALRAAEPLKTTTIVPLPEASGRVLHDDVTADRDLPPFNRSQMDGYALRSAEFGLVDAWPSAGTLPAGRAFTTPVPPGHCVAIATGAPLPDELDAVIPHELSDRGDLHGRPVRFTIETLKPGQAVHPRGADARAGQVVLPAGTLLGPMHLGIAAGVGRAQLNVRGRPRAAVLTSGDEVIESGNDLTPYQIRNSNGPMLADLVTRFGGEVVRRKHVRDDRDAVMAAFGAAIEQADVVLTVGGVSAGDRDHFPAAFDAFDVERSLHGAAIQPGRPIFVGRAPCGAVVIGLPGNPVSALACACLFVWPLVRRLLGLNGTLPWRRVTLRGSVRPNARRRAFRPAIAVGPDEVCIPTWAGSGDLVHTVPTSGLAELPVQRDEITEGSIVRFLPYP